MTLQSPTATLIPLFSSSELTGCGYLGLLDRKIVQTCAPGGSRTLDFLHARRAPYPLGQALQLFGLCVCRSVFQFCNDVPRVAQRYGTIAAHTRHRASVLVVFLVFCVHVYSFTGLIRWTPSPTFSDTAIANRHSDTTILSSELTGC